VRRNGLVRGRHNPACRELRIGASLNLGDGAVALFMFLPATAWARIVASDLLSVSVLQARRPYSSQGMFDPDQSQTASLSNFTCDVDFYGDQLGLAEALEFDINQFFGDMGFIFGHECRIADGNQWDIWDNSKNKWIPTGIPCYPKSGQWNHLTLKVQRTSDNHETYQSITLNGQNRDPELDVR
jgi:hypothetical protein